MATILFVFPGNEKLAYSLIEKLGAEKGEFTTRQFPDGETYLQLLSDVKDKRVVLLCTLYRPDDKFLPLYFFSQTLKEQGAVSVCLLAPYLAYMRQDKQFHEGEVVTSRLFAKLLSQFVDSIITVDPHLHRINSLSEIYTIPTKTLHADNVIADWIKKNIRKPVLVGPDMESKQWVEEVAKKTNTPFLILEKLRRGDKDVEVSVPDIERYKDHTPVLVDDIISTARTMIKTVEQLNNAGMQPTVCIGVHALFSGDAYEELKKAEVEQIVTCNTIQHESNQIDISNLLIEAL